MNLEAVFRLREPRGSGGSGSDIDFGSDCSVAIMLALSMGIAEVDASGAGYSSKAGCTRARLLPVCGNIGNVGKVGNVATFGSGAERGMRSMGCGANVMIGIAGRGIVGTKTG